MPICLCCEPHCPEPATYRGRCPTHAAALHKGNRSVNDAFYDTKAWRATRARFLFDHPLCQYRLPDGRECGVVADSVHHIVELGDGGAPRDPTNLMSTCRSHHSMIHAHRRGEAIRR
jgi:hypothetical protein